MNDRLQRVEAELTAELAQIDTELGELNGRRDRLMSDRERVTASRDALRPNRSARVKNRGQPRRPCAKKPEVAAIVRQLLDQNGPCPEADLIGLAEDRLRKEGKSLSGFKLRYDAVRDELLEETGDGGVGLRADNPKP